MDKMLYIAMSGAKQNLQGVRVHANNLANANTQGFRKDFEQARAMQAYGEGLPSRVFSMTERPGSDFTHGGFMSTNRDLDVAIAGDGWLAVQAANGGEAYTRAGHLQLDENGQLRNGANQPILGEDGNPITLPQPLAKVQVGSDGTISYLPKGAPPDAIEQGGRIKLVNPSIASLVKGADGLFRTQDGLPQAADPTVSLVSGKLEASNVSAVGEMVQMIDLQRQFDMQVKAMKAAEENDSVQSQLLKMS
ncbi:flagellar basal-body rod protein FlgF [Plesiomonas shigelloides]|uniref:flagellar basal-body rod protein FlgF n=1 Tax=Plesiomonas shigelloides TaxID=703 RepID=UPI001261767F|nr:flagellar basal-body rod protein FlgF [Plesiomonas shigelloides]KAB7690000.1 flagellar basal-body rod protein FlgF [Plesiomonas shigelloides]